MPNVEAHNEDVQRPEAARPIASNVLCQLFPVDLLFGRTAYGARVAHLELLDALARFSGRERNLKLVIDTAYSPGPPPLPGNANSQIESLKAKGMSVSVHEVLALMELLAGNGTVMLSSGQESVRVLAARELTEHHTPVCTLCHSLVWPDYVSSYSTAAALSRPYDRLVVPSQAGVDAVRAIHDALSLSHPALWRDDAVHIRRIPYGVFPDQFGLVEQEQARALLNIPQDSFVLGYVGRLTDRLKADLDPLLIVTWRLLKMGLKPYLLLAGAEGQEGYKTELDAKAGLLGISSHFCCRSDFDEAIKSLIYSASDVCVFPVDNVQETFGLAVLEAMASAKPVVASNWSGYRELVVDGETGFLIDCSVSEDCARVAPFLMTISRPIAAEAYMAKQTAIDVDALFSALVRLARNPELCKKYGAAARSRVVSQFSWAESVRQFEELWAEQRDVARYTRPAKIAPANGRECQHYLSAYSASQKKLIALVCDSNTSALIAEFGLVALGVLPAPLRAKARQCLDLIVRNGRVDFETLPPDLRTAAWMLAKKGIVSAEYGEMYASATAASKLRRTA
jgi:glycosyltransferase involved in cell wall biosynthesis